MAVHWQPDSLLHDVRFAIRGLLRQPGFACSVTALLAMAIGANVAMFSAFHQALIRPLPYDEPESLVMGRATIKGKLNPDMSAHDFIDYGERNRVFDSVGAIITSPTNVTVTGGERPEQVSASTVSWDLFPTLGIPAAAGRFFTAAESEPGGPNVVVISGRYWLRRFGGSPEIIGSTIQVDGSTRTIVGAMPPGFSFLNDVELWTPMRLGDPKAHSRGWLNWLMVGRLKRGVSIERAQADVDIISAQLAAQYPGTNRDKALRLTELRSVIAGESRLTIGLMMAAVGLVLLIACGNVAGLLLARGAARRTELCIRAAVGASAPRMARQLLTESMVTATAGGVLGTALAIIFQKTIVHFIPLDIPGVEDLGVSWPMLLFALVVTVATGLLFGALPAVQAARHNIVSTVRSGSQAFDAGSQRYHGWLVVAQVTITVILLVGSGLLLRSLASLRAVNPGFDTHNLLTTEIRLAADRYPDKALRIELFSALTAELLTIPGVEDVAVINQLPIRDPGNNIMVFAAHRPPPDPNDRISSYRRTVLPGYFAAMGIPLLRGRDIDTTDTADAPPVLVINESMARSLFPGEDPLGRLVNVQRDIDSEVIGIVGDVRVSGPRSRPELVMYSSYFQEPGLTMRLALRTSDDPTPLAESVRRAVWALDRDVPVARLSSMDEIIAHTVSSDRVVALSVTLYASIAVLLAILGLYGVMAYHVSLRIHEIGVRVALGAGAHHVLFQIMKRGLCLVACGLALGLAGAFWASRLLQHILFDIAPTDATTFVTVGVLFAVVSLVASLIPARKALKVNPAKALGGWC